MKAVVYTRYGPPTVLQLKDIEKPVPRQNEVLIRVFSTTVNRTDNATIKAIPFFARIFTGLFKPNKQTPGTEFSGVIEQVGENVASLKVGDNVFGFNDLGCMGQNIFLPMITPFIKPLLEMKKTVTPFPVNIRKSLLLVKQLIEKGEFTALIDKTYLFEDIIEAYKYVEKGHKKGNVVIIVHR